MHLDMSKVKARMRLLNRRVLPGKIRRGLTGAGNRLMIDTVTKDPTVPIKRPGYFTWTTGKYGSIATSTDRKAGELRASGALFVDGVKKRTTTHYGELATGMYQPSEYGGTPIVPGNHEACVVFNAPYAAGQHEQWPKKTQAGAGRYYLSKKLYGNAMEYTAIIARAIQL